MTSRQFSHSPSHASNRASSQAQSQPFEAPSLRYHSLPTTPHITTTIVLDPHLHPSLPISSAAPTDAVRPSAQHQSSPGLVSPSSGWNHKLHPRSPVQGFPRQTLPVHIIQNGQLSRTPTWPDHPGQLQIPTGSVRERSISQPPYANEPVSPLTYGGQRKRSTSNLGPRPDIPSLGFPVSNES